MQPKLGHLHIPKSAGTSLNRAIYTALEQAPVHVSKILPAAPADGKVRPSVLVEGSEAFHKASRLRFVSGHLTYTGLKKLDRSFIFTVLRDPRQRLLSLFSYEVSRAVNEKVTKNNPGLKKFANMGFYDYIEIRRPSNGLAKILLADIPGFERLLADGRTAEGRVTLQAELDAALQRLDVIYACSLQDILDDLHTRGFIGKTEEIWVNKSDNEKVNFGEPRTRADLLDALRRATELDVFVYERARALFPRYVTKALATDEELVADVEKRFAVRFPD